jgi:hypothetical protein
VRTCPRKEQKKVLDDRTYSRRMEIISEHAGGKFLLFHLDHVKYLNGDTLSAVVLADILNTLRMKDSNPKDRKHLKANNLWFKHQRKQVQSRLGISDFKQRRAFLVLEKKNLIKTENREGNSTWVKVNTKKLTKLPSLIRGKRHQNSINSNSDQTLRNSRSDFEKLKIRTEETQDPIYINKEKNKDNLIKPPTAELEQKQEKSSQAKKSPHQRGKTSQFSSSGRKDPSPYPPPQTSGGPATSSEYYKRAERLRQCLSQMGKNTEQFNMYNESSQFERMCLQYGESRVDDFLTLYEEGGKGITDLTIHNAKSMAQIFTRLEEKLGTNKYPNPFKADDGLVYSIVGEEGRLFREPKGEDWVYLSDVVKYRNNDGMYPNQYESDYRIKVPAICIRNREIGG